MRRVLDFQRRLIDPLHGMIVSLRGCTLSPGQSDQLQKEIRELMREIQICTPPPNKKEPKP